MAPPETEPPRPPRDTLRRAIDRVPTGRWGVAVSGGADSVATLWLLSRRARQSGDLSLIVIHVDHELRGEASAGDAAFVSSLAQRLSLPIHLRTRTQLESAAVTPAEPPKRRSPAYLRWLRLNAYRDAVGAYGLRGVVLGHHADDLAETLAMRLLRGSPRSGTLGLAPVGVQQHISGVTLLRPMLQVRRARLRGLLHRARQPWREDASNADPRGSLRNRLRRLLVTKPGTTEALLRLASAAAGAERCLREATPVLPEKPTLEQLHRLPQVLRRRAVRAWLIARGLPQSDAGPAMVDAAMSVTDAAGPRVVDLPGGLRLLRVQGRLQVAR